MHYEIDFTDGASLDFYAEDSPVAIENAKTRWWTVEGIVKNVPTKILINLDRVNTILVSKEDSEVPRG